MSNGIVTIRGVIQPPGAGGGGTSTSWTLHFGLLAWRESQGEAWGELQERKLRLTREVSEEELDAYMEMLQPFAVVELSVHLDAEVLEEVIAVDVEDDVLEAFAEQAQVPVEHVHPTFGMFAYDRGVSWFEANTTWLGQDVRLHLSTQDVAAFDTIVAHAETLWADAAGWDARVRAFVVDEMLPSYNEDWNDDAPLTAEAFLARIRLESIGIFDNGSFELWFDDGDLFGGYSIVAGGSFDEGFTEACFVE